MMKTWMFHLMGMATVVLTGLAQAEAADRQAPQWTVTTPDQKRVQADDYAGKHVLLIFHRGVGCVHCLEQLTKLGAQSSDFQERGIELLGISQALPQSRDLDRLRERQGIDFPLATDPRLSTFHQLGCLGRNNVPMHGLILIGPDQKILWQSVKAMAVTDIDSILAACDAHMK